MDVPPQGSHHHQHGDADTDLSFEALTFGEDSSPLPLSPSSTGGGSSNNLLNNGKKEPKANKNKNKPFKKDRSPGVPSHEAEKDKSMSSVYVSTRSEGERIDVQGLLKRLEQFGVVKAYYFKEKQNFGFIQFLDSSVIDLVIENINTIPFQTDDGTVQLTAERAAGRGTTLPNGESPSQGSFGASTSFGTNFGIPFSPSTPVTTPNMMMGGGGGANANNANNAMMMMMMMSSSAPSSSSSSSSINGGGLSALASPNPSASITSPTPEKPDTILVLKNLPFSLKQDQLQEILMMMNTTAPQSINLHFDNMGVFRGMAFIKYRLLDDAIKVYEALNGYDVGGRKVRVEYKRKNKGQQTDIPLEWQEEEDLRKLWEQVKDFSNNPNVNEISFTPNLTSNQRKHIHTMAEKLKLTHYSNGEGELRYICIKKPPPTTSPTPTTTASSSSSFSSSNNNNNNSTSQNGFSVPIPTNGAIDIKGGRNRPRRDSDSTTNPSAGGGARHGGGSPIIGSNGNGNHHNGGANGNGNNMTVGSVEGKSEYNRLPRSSFASKQKDVASSAPADINMDWRSQNSQNGNNNSGGGGGSSMISSSPAQSPSLSGVTIAPSRQPKGPDGSKGFSDMYKSARKQTNSFLPENAVVQEIQAVV